VLWNTNRLVQHAEEIKTYIQNQKVDIILISETHFTKKSYIKIPNNSIYDTQQPDGTAHGGTAIIMKKGIKHHLHGHYNLEHLQATSHEDRTRPLKIAEVYCPKHAIKAEQFLSFYANLRQRFLAGGD
jgi:exonuclease III